MKKLVEYNKEYYYRNPNRRLRCILACRVYGAFKRKKWIRNGKNEQILGCTIDVARQHIESQFDENMSWDNYGTYWEVDHIIPLYSAKTHDEMIALCHYTNLQPLTVTENRSKEKKIIKKEEK